MSCEELVGISEWYVEGLRTAISLVRSDLNDSDSGYCKAGAHAVRCGNCANDLDLKTGQHGYCMKESYDKSFQLGSEDARKIMKSEPALLCIRCNFVLKAPVRLLEALESFVRHADDCSIYCRREGLTGDSTFCTGALRDVQKFINYCDERRFDPELMKQFKKELSEEEFGWLICGRR